MTHETCDETFVVDATDTLQPIDCSRDTNSNGRQSSSELREAQGLGGYSLGRWNWIAQETEAPANTGVRPQGSQFCCFVCLPPYVQHHQLCDTLQEVSGRRAMGLGPQRPLIKVSPEVVG